MMGVRVVYDVGNYVDVVVSVRFVKRHKKRPVVDMVLARKLCKEYLVGQNKVPRVSYNMLAVKYGLYKQKVLRYVKMIREIDGVRK